MAQKSPYPKTHNPSYLNAVRTWVLRILDDSSSPLLDLIDVKKGAPLLRWKALQQLFLGLGSL